MLMTELMPFIESLRTDENNSTIDAIKDGYLEILKKQFKTIKNHLKWSDKEFVVVNIGGNNVKISHDTEFIEILEKMLY